MKIFVDEGAWLALTDKAHPLHQPTKEIFMEFLSVGHRFYTTNVIIGNTLSNIRKNQGAVRANRFYEIMEEAWLSTHLHILWIGRRTQKDAVRLFKKFPEMELTLFDCANIVLMNRRNIRFIMSDNSVYEQMGFKVVPGNMG